MGTKPRSGRPEKLTPKQEAFVREYLVDLNATQAAKRAGYSEKTAQQQGAENLSKPLVAAAIAEAQAARAKRVQINADRVLEEDVRLALSDIGDVMDFTGDEMKLKPVKDIPESARRAIASVKVKRYTEGHGEDAREVEVTEFKFWDKGAALDRVRKHLGIPDKVEVTGKDGAPLKTDLTLNIPTVDTAQVIAILRGAGVADRVAPSAPVNGDGKP